VSTTDIRLANVIDNRDSQLLEHIRHYLPFSKALHFAVGYFFLSGFEAIQDVIPEDTQIRLLIGNTTNRQTIDALARGYRRLEDAQAALKRDNLSDLKPSNRRDVLNQTALNARETLEAMDGSENDARVVRNLVGLIESGRMKVRCFTKDGGVLHAKAYIFDYKATQASPGIAFVGSSNLSLGGLAHNSELNVALHEPSYHAHLHQWFDQLWNQSEDFDVQLVKEMRSSWAINPVTPQELYLKTLYHLVQGRLDDAKDLDKVWSAYLPPLTVFQEVAVNQAIRILEEWNGVIVGDVVGLGKSYIAVGLLTYYRRIFAQRALIVCPAPLVEMWEDYNDTYDLGAAVVSMTNLANLGDQLTTSDRYRNRDLVVIDESHNFRNSNTSRYAALRDFMDKVRPKAILLTATPQNNTPFDILHQVQLFHPEESTTLPIDPPELTRFVSLCNKGERRIQDLLRPIFIRRTRRHIERFFPDAVLPATGEKITFPKRELKTLEYNITAVYEGEAERISNDLLTLSYAKYGLYDYVKPAQRDKEPYKSLKGSGSSFRGIMRSMLYKRFESSVEAFRRTLERLVSLHKAFLLALDAGQIAVGNEAQKLLTDADAYDEPSLLELLEAIDKRYKAEDFNLERLKADVRSDLQTLVNLHKRIGPITAEKDDKLQLLRSTLLNFRAQGKKILVFTQFSDTAQYLFDNLKDFEAIERVYSGQGNRLKLVGRFSPRSSRYQLAPGEHPIEILIATDVLSEGLNLQDAQAIVNYDLHWNPVRLIQRAGRIDRLGSQNEIIEFANFLPHREIEQTLQLRARLARRIQEIHEAIGEDAAILEPSELLNEEAMYAIYTGDVNALDVFEGHGESLGIEEAEEIIRALRVENPNLYERIRSLPLGVRSGKSANTDAAAFVFCAAGDYQRLFLTDNQGNILSDDFRVALSILKADETTPRLEPPTGFNDLVAKVRSQFAADVKRREAEQRTLRKTPAQRYILQQLEGIHSSLFAETDIGNVEYLFDLFTRNWGAGVERRLKRLTRDRCTGKVLLEGLNAIATEFSLHARAREVNAQNTVELPLVICAEHLG
jgi:superfamily II DNA or RNA helicase